MIREIRRQDPKLGSSGQERAFIRGYRAAVKSAADGNIRESFDRLDQLGCIREIAPEQRRDALATEYLVASTRKERALVVAQTREEVQAVNETIRGKLRDSGGLGADSMLTTCQPLDLGDAQKRDPRFYQPGQQACFLQNYGRFAKGSTYEIAGTNERGVVIMKDGRRSTLSYRYTDRMVVAATSSMAVAPGDRLQLKLNGKSVEGTRLNNGELVTVRKVRDDGALVVADAAGVPKTLAPSQRVFQRGYAVTSYASQGKTVDAVILADAASRAATNAQQWYVAVSRGRKRVIVFTSDKAELKSSISRSGERELAVDLKTTVTAPLRTQAPLWAQRALAAIDLNRRHQAVLNRFRPNAQRISL